MWTATCRITIHYATIGTRPGHIHPLWSVPRPAGGVDDGMGNITFPDTCTQCHSRVSPADPAVVQLPAASLELTDEVSDEDALQLRAYRHLLFARPRLALVNGAIQVVTVPGPPDDDGNPHTDSGDAAAIDGGGQCTRLAVLQRDEQSDACRYALDR